MKSETPLLDLDPELFNTILKVQDALAEWIVPHSGISDHDVLNTILGIVDRQDLVKKMREALPPVLKKYWPESPNVEHTFYYPNGDVLEIRMKNNTTYQYLDVPRELWDRLVEAPSIGSFMHRELKGQYRYQRI